MALNVLVVLGLISFLVIRGIHATRGKWNPPDDKNLPEKTVDRKEK
jgi:hypothetical protein